MSLPSAGRTWNISDPLELPNSIHHLHTFTSGHLPFFKSPRNLQGQLFTNMMHLGMFFFETNVVFFGKKSDTTTAIVEPCKFKHVRKPRHRYSTSQEFQTSKNPRPTKPDGIQELHRCRSIKLEDLPIPDMNGLNFCWQMVEL